MWTQRTLSTFQTFTKSQENGMKTSSFFNGSLPRHQNGNGQASSLHTENNEQTSTKNGIFSGTFPRVNGMSKAKAVSVPIIPFSPPNRTIGSVPSKHGLSKSLVEETKDGMELHPIHSHSHSLSFASTDSNGETDYSINGNYVPTEDDVI